MKLQVGQSSSPLYESWESLTIDRETMQVKDSLALKYAELLYAGRWFDPLCESLDKFMEKITECTTGSVELKLYTEVMLL
jgi:argininosuccinate synthase